MANQARFKIFDGVTVAGGSTITAVAIPLGFSSGFFCIEGTVSSSSPDHSLTFKWYRSDGENTQSTEEGTINSSGITGTTFNEHFSPEYVSHIVVKCSNASGKETATVNCTLCFSEQL